MKTSSTLEILVTALTRVKLSDSDSLAAASQSVVAAASICARLAVVDILSELKVKCSE